MDRIDQCKWKFISSRLPVLSVGKRWPCLLKKYHTITTYLETVPLNVYDIDFFLDEGLRVQMYILGHGADMVLEGPHRLGVLHDMSGLNLVSIHLVKPENS